LTSSSVGMSILVRVLGSVLSISAIYTPIFS
jgi:hypothetical protein